MKKMVTALLFTVMAPSAFAADSKQVLELLKKNADQIQAMDSSGEKISKEEFKQLLIDFTAQEKDKKISQSLECKNVTQKGLVGAKHEDCVLSINNTSTYEDEQFESSMIIDVKLTTPVVPNAKPSLRSNVIKVDLAG